MSPTIFAVPRIEPSQSGRSDGGWGGTMSATGLPKRVMRSGRPVRRTRSNAARQVALNLDMGMVSMPELLTWSENMVKPSWCASTCRSPSSIATQAARFSPRRAVSHPRPSGGATDIGRRASAIPPASWRREPPRRTKTPATACPLPHHDSGPALPCQSPPPVDRLLDLHRDEHHGRQQQAERELAQGERRCLEDGVEPRNVQHRHL